MQKTAFCYQLRLTIFKHLFNVANKCLNMEFCTAWLCRQPENFMSKKEQLYALIRARPMISQQELADCLSLSRSAVAGHIAGLIREGRLLGRAYQFPEAARVLCIGGANTDRKLRTASPLQMGTSNPASMSESFGGVARNIAENLARTGVAVSLLTAVGTDSAGQGLMQHAGACGIDTSLSRICRDMSSGTYTALLDAQGEMTLALAVMDIYEQLDVSYLSAQVPVSGYPLLVADMNLPAASLAWLMQRCSKGLQKLVIVAVSAPKMARLPERLDGTALMILNRDELLAATGATSHTGTDWQALARSLLQRGAEKVLVTAGEHGVWGVEATQSWHLPALPVQVRDVTGAGDAFSAGVLAGLMRAPDDLQAAARQGLKLAALTLQSEQTVAGDLHPAIFE